jgi:DHA2 family multidrug resistance protein
MHRPRAHGDRFLSLQLFLDQGERYEWFDSKVISALGVIAACALVGFLVRELTAAEPILDLGVYRDRNFAASSLIMLVVMFGFFSSMVLLALFTQKLLGYDAWTSGTVLAPGGLGNLVSLIIAGRLISRSINASSGCGLLAERVGGLEHVDADTRRGPLGARVARFAGLGIGFISCRSTRWRSRRSGEAMGNATALPTWCATWAAAWASRW